MYFTAPAAEALHVYRERLFPWGYGHMLIFGSIAATGAGLNVAACYIGEQRRKPTRQQRHTAARLRSEVSRKDHRVALYVGHKDAIGWVIPSSVRGHVG
jgi:hypothetical protein